MRRLWLFVALSFLVLGLYSIAGTSDQLDVLTALQRAEVVARW